MLMKGDEKSLFEVSQVSVFFFSFWGEEVKGFLDAQVPSRSFPALKST